MSDIVTKYDSSPIKGLNFSRQMSVPIYMYVHRVSGEEPRRVEFGRPQCDSEIHQQVAQADL